MHGRPTSDINNSSLWDSHRFQEYGISGEAFLLIRDVEYFTDTGRSWASENNIRDWSAHFFTVNGLRTTDDVLNHIASVHPPRLYINAHPERWAYSIQNRIVGLLRDCLFNNGKKMLGYYRS